MKTLILNSSNVDNTSNNSTYKYNFPAGAVNFKDEQIAVAMISMYYSWFNINSSMYNNNQFSYTWIDNTTINITLPDGYYDIPTINSYLQSVMYTNKHYMVDSSGNNTYFLEIVTNPTYYAVQINAYPVTSSYTTPQGASWRPNSTTPTLTIPSTNNFYKIVGFSPATYPPSPSQPAYSSTSTTTPQVSPVSSLTVSCSLVNNRYSVPNNVIFSFTPQNTTFGSLVTIQPPNFSFVDITDGLYNSFTVTFTDQNFQRIQIKDPQVVIMLVIKSKTEVNSK